MTALLHRDVLNEIARKHGMPECRPFLHAEDYLGRALNIMCVELGLMTPDGKPVRKFKDYPGSASFSSLPAPEVK